MTAILGLVAVWLMSCYFNSPSSLWCRIGMLSPAGQPHLFGLLGCYPAVGWTTAALLVDGAVLVTVCVLAHALSQYSSQKITTEDGERRTKRSFASTRAVHFYVNVLGCSAVAAGLGIGLQFGWGPTFAVPLVLLGLVVLAIFSGVNPWRAAEAEPGESHQESLRQSGQDVGRLRQLLKGKDGQTLPVRLIDSSEILGTDGAWLGYRLAANEPGFFSSAEGRRLLSTLTAEMRGGGWSYTSDSGTDIVSFTRPEQQGWPRWAVPHPDLFEIVTSADEATRLYPGFRMPLGIDQTGQPVEFSLAAYPMVALVGESGSGKSIMMTTLVEWFLTAGWQIGIGDGKLVDYGPLRDRVIMVTSSDEEYARFIYWVWQEMMDRKTEMNKRKKAGIADSGAFPPLLAIFDEFAAMYLRLQDRFGKEFKDIMRKVSQIQKEGRQLRVHAIFATQTFRNTEFPRAVLDGCPLRISLGPPNKITLEQAFQEKVRWQADHLGQQMGEKAKGRGLVSLKDAPAEQSLKEFQSWYGYSPAHSKTDTDKDPETVQKQHRYLRDHVSKRIPKLYSRQWFAIEFPEEWQGTFADICKIRSVSLDKEDGGPDPAMACYDPDHKNYNGYSHSGRQWGQEIRVIK
jgi:hypothetical protein